MKKIIILVAALSVAFGCKEHSSHTLIAPLPSGLSVSDLQDCTVPASFAIGDFQWQEGKLELTVYSKDLYDAVEISQMQVGDTLVYASERMVITRIEESHGGLEINGGLEEGGCCLSGYEGGTYVARNCDDHATYTRLGKAMLPLAEDFQLVDCGEFPQDPADTIRTDIRRYLETLSEGRRDFFQLNTRVEIQEGKIRRILRHWIP